MVMTHDDFEKVANRWGRERLPFLFILDFELEKPFALPLRSVDATGILYDVNGRSNAGPGPGQTKIDFFQLKALDPEDYRRKFSIVYDHLQKGDSYLTNLTIRSEIALDVSLQDIYFRSHAKYKLLMPDRFLVYSPEIFVQTRDKMIFACPMKGTIDAGIPGAREMILRDPKELAEHVTIVDLIRNDLSQVSANVRVLRFRYVDQISTSHKKLLQVSSEIAGDLPDTFPDNIGTLLMTLLPAGSVTGAPKPRTLEIIRMAEGEKRGYYTGVFGIFDGENIDSGVMIRFIEMENGTLYYRSGGGITTRSNCETEYQEALDKIYVPLN